MVSDEFYIDNKIIKNGQYSLKWCKYQKDKIIPFDIADMDFAISEEILKSISEKVESGFFGYGIIPIEINKLIKSDIYNKYRWKIDEDWIVWIPGIVSGIHIALKAFCNRNKSVLTFIPYYPPFYNAAQRMEILFRSYLLENKNEFWNIDFSKLSEQFKNDVSLFLISSPHNPTGKVWSRDELLKIAQICIKKNIIICSDEIHCDFIFEEGDKHVPMASINKQIQNNSITFMSASKTYNLAGLSCGYAIISNPEIRERFISSRMGMVPSVTNLGYEATIAAYKYGSKWFVEIKEKLKKNKFIIKEFCIKNKLGISHTNATYLAWINIAHLDISDPVSFFVKHGFRILDGRAFGLPGYIRFNFACSEKLLLEGLKRFQIALDSI